MPAFKPGDCVAVKSECMIDIKEQHRLIRGINKTLAEIGVVSYSAAKGRWWVVYPSHPTGLAFHTKTLRHVSADREYFIGHTADVLGDNPPESLTTAPKFFPDYKRAQKWLVDHNHHDNAVLIDNNEYPIGNVAIYVRCIRTTAVYDVESDTWNIVETPADITPTPDAQLGYQMNAPLAKEITYSGWINQYNDITVESRRNPENNLWDVTIKGSPESLHKINQYIMGFLAGVKFAEDQSR